MNRFTYSKHKYLSESDTIYFFIRCVLLNDYISESASVQRQSEQLISCIKIDKHQG